MQMAVKSVGNLPLFDPGEGKVVFAPEKDEAGYWVGAPSAWVDGNEVYISTRHCRPLSSGRGWKSAISRSADGENFEEIWACFAEDFDTESIERSALVRAPSGEWRLCISYVDHERRWRIDLLEADCPEELNPAARIPIMDSTTTQTEGVKDPYVMFLGGATYMFVAYAPLDTVVPGSTHEDLHGIGNVFTTGLVLHPSGLWISADGRKFDFVRDITVPGHGWDRNVARLASVVPNGAGYTIFYDGWITSGDVYEDKTGFCTSLDLVHVFKHTVDGAALQSPHGTGCMRYMDCVRRGDELLYYYELGTATEAHELRLMRLPVPDA
ncbi:MAG: hypothetical protein QGG58_03320 [Chloroflexota bacterium]|nr:hypothetical protein [Chloroflexota bacterium]